MTGPEHYREAERLIAEHTAAMDAAIGTVAEKVNGANAQQRKDIGLANLLLTRAKVHATLALAAATAYPAVVAYTGDDMGVEARGWANATAPAAVSS